MGSKVELVTCGVCGGCGRVGDGEGDSMRCGPCGATGERHLCTGCGLLLDPVEVEAGCIVCGLDAAARHVAPFGDHQAFTHDETDLTSPGTPTGPGMAADMPSCRRVA